MWYGLLEDGELVSVHFFMGRPSVLDFKALTTTSSEYEVIELIIQGVDGTRYE